MTDIKFRPADWNGHLAEHVHWRHAYDIVAVETRRLLQTFTPDRQVTTTQLVELLYPEEFARADGITTRKRIFKALAALATRSLADCASRGEPRKLRHGARTVRPWMWHVPGVELNPEAQSSGEARLCPHCGGVI